jgi:protein TonB
VAVYGGLLGAGLALAWSSPAKAAPRRTVALVLDSFEPGPPPPPAAGPAGGTAAPAGAAPPVAAPDPDRSAGAALPVAEPTLATTGAPKEAHGLPGGGLEGGQPNGAPGGVPGGQAGGTEGGQVGAIAPPRFDALYLQNPEPEYPSLSRRLGEEGRVLLRVLVNAEGLPEQVELRQSSGHPRLDQAALGTVRRWRFTPARRGSERLAAWVLVPLSFRLD